MRVVEREGERCWELRLLAGPKCGACTPSKRDLITEIHSALHMALMQSQQHALLPVQSCMSTSCAPPAEHAVTQFCSNGPS